MYKQWDPAGILDQINAGLVSKRDFFKKNYKSYCSKNFDW